MVEQMGWIRRVRGNRPTPRMNEVEFQHEEELMRLKKELVSLMKDPERFIETVIGSRDPIWLDRCSSIIVDV